MRSGRQEIVAAMVKSAFGGAGVSRRGFMQSGAAAALGMHMMSEAVEQALSQERPWEQTSDKKVQIGVVGGERPPPRPARDAQRQVQMR